MGLRRRVGNVEARIRARASPAGNRSPEEEAERERQFEQLYREAGFAWPPAPTDPQQIRAELCAAVARSREESEKGTV